MCTSVHGEVMCVLVYMVRITNTVFDPNIMIISLT